MIILFMILFVVYATIDIHMKDKTLDELMYLRWVLEGHPGADCSTEFQCPIHKKSGS